MRHSGFWLSAVALVLCVLVGAGSACLVSIPAEMPASAAEYAASRATSAYL